MIDTIIKRDGRRVAFDSQKIADAIMKAFQASNSAKTYKTAEELTRQVLQELEKNESIGEPGVEEVQDTVERVLIENGFGAHGQKLYPLSRRAQPYSRNEHPADAHLRRHHQQGCHRL